MSDVVECPYYSHEHNPKGCHELDNGKISGMPVTTIQNI